MVDRDKLIRAVASSHAIESDRPTEYWERWLRNREENKMITNLERGETLDYLEKIIDYLDSKYKQEGDLMYSAACEDVECARNSIMDDTLFNDLKER